MEWLSRLGEQRAQKDCDDGLVRARAAESWASLQGQLKDARDEYTKLFPPEIVRMQVQYDLTNANQSVFKRMTPKKDGKYAVEKDRVTLQFHAPATITATYSTQQPPVILYVRKDKEGRALIEYGKDNVSLDRACELILRPILFDDLPKDS